MDLKSPAPQYIKYTSLGALIRSKRLQLGLQQNELARVVEVSPQYLCDIEADRRTPGNDTLEMLAAMCELNTWVLYYYAGRIPPDLQRPGTQARIITEAWAAFHNVLVGIE